MNTIRLSLAVILAAFSITAQPDQTVDARATAMELVQKLGSALKQELAAGGPGHAASACRDIAPRLASELSRKIGGRVTRVSLKARNPLLGQPDPWEQRVLLDFDRRAAAGEKPEKLEHAEVVDEPQGSYFRYMKALPVQPLCLTCHGSGEAVPDEVRVKLATDYPYDRAFGYTLGQIRGAVTIKQRMGTQ